MNTINAKKILAAIGIIAIAAVIGIAFVACGSKNSTPPGPTDTTAPVLSAGVLISRTSETEGTITFTSDEAGTAFYVELATNATAPTSEAVKAGTSLGAAVVGVNANKSVTLTAGARNIYVVVEDGAGNISAPLLIAAAAFDTDPNPPVLTVGSYSRSSHTAATITFTSSKAGTAYYRVVNTGVSAPTVAEIRTGGTLIGAAVSGVNTNKPVTLTEGAKDLYVIVTDTRLRDSNALKIEIGPYVVAGDGEVTVIFNSMGGSQIQPLIVEEGDTATKPATDPIHPAVEVEGLFAGPIPAPAFLYWADEEDGEDEFDFANTPIEEDITLYAVWGMPNPLDLGTGLGSIVTKAVNYIKADPTKEYFLYLNAANTICDPMVLDEEGFDLTIIGIGTGEKVIQLAATAGSFDPENPLTPLYTLFTMKGQEGAEINLTIGENITLKGISNGNSALVIIERGHFTMLDGSTLTGNTNKNPNWGDHGAGAVKIAGGKFTMKGGTITGNTSALGALMNDYQLSDTSGFYMEAGSITGNTGTFGIADNVFILNKEGTFGLLLDRYAEIDDLGLLYMQEADATLIGSFKITANWTGSVKVNLFAVVDEDGDIDDAVDAWKDQQIVALEGAGSLSTKLTQITLLKMYAVGVEFPVGGGAPIGLEIIEEGDITLALNNSGELKQD